MFNSDNPFNPNRNARSTGSKAASLVFNNLPDDEVSEEEVHEMPETKEEEVKAPPKTEGKKAVEEEVQLTEAEIEELRKQELYALIEKNGGPTAGEITEIKRRMGRVHVMLLDDDRLIIIRPLKRIEFKNFKELQSKQNFSNDDLEEQITQKCLVFPKLDASDFNQLEGGLVSSVYKEILEISLFLSDDTLSRITIKL